MVTSSKENELSGPFKFAVDSYGVKILVSCDKEYLSSQLKFLAEKSLLGNLKHISLESDTTHQFYFLESRPDTYTLIRNNEEPITELSEDTATELFVRMLRLIISENAKDKVFIHAGVVALNGKALIIPGESGSGKTSLVIELIKKGAVYYSDEYAVIDETGMIHPFARELSVKSKDRQWSEKNGIQASEFGAISGTEPLPLGYVLLTRFSENNMDKFEELSIGNGILETIPHTITFSKKPEFSLNVLKTAFSRAIIFSGLRGESENAANQLLSLFDY